MILNEIKLFRNDRAGRSAAAPPARRGKRRVPNGRRRSDRRRVYRRDYREAYEKHLPAKAIEFSGNPFPIRTRVGVSVNFPTAVDGPVFSFGLVIHFSPASSLPPGRFCRITVLPYVYINIYFMVSAMFLPSKFSRRLRTESRYSYCPSPLPDNRFSLSSLGEFVGVYPNRVAATFTGYAVS